MLDHDAIALDIRDELPTRYILERYDLTVQQLRDWIESPIAQATFAAIDTINHIRERSLGCIEEAAIAALARIVKSGLTTETVRKACHDIIRIKRERETENDVPLGTESPVPSASQSTSDVPRNTAQPCFVSNTQELSRAEPPTPSHIQSASGIPRETHVQRPCRTPHQSPGWQPRAARALVTLAGSGTRTLIE